jgi:toxin CcdB
MARFDVHRGEGEPLLLDCQTDLLEGINSRLMVPLYRAERVERKVLRLNPVFNVAGHDMVMLTQSMGAVPIKRIGARIDSLRAEQDAIMNAIDMLLSGY